MHDDDIKNDDDDIKNDDDDNNNFNFCLIVAFV